MAGLIDQRMVARLDGSPSYPFTFRTGSVAFWAWVVSIVVHLAVLTAFAAVKLSQSEAKDKQRPAPTAKVSRIKKLMQAALVIPKPKIKKSAESRLVKRADQLPPISRIFDTVKPDTKDLGNLAKPFISRSGPSAGSVILPHRIEFFGSFTDRRKVCYLVDCSGSMQGLFTYVRKKLKDSIRNLQPDQYFYIIFFGNDRLLEFGKGRLLRATEKNKAGACDFIKSVRPAGKTNAMAALERAVQIRDSRGAGPETIYFLTDGFELTTQDARQFSRKIANLLGRFAPATRINTIGFWSASDDRVMLKTIAVQSGGEYVFITDDDS